MSNSASQSPALSQSAVREVLQYVPIFSGKSFVVTLDGRALPEYVIAEVLLDLIALQRIGVKLVIVYAGEDLTSLLHWAAEVELKLSEAHPQEAANVLSRGQAALVDYGAALTFGSDLVDLALSVKARKILHLGHTADYPAQWTGALTIDHAHAAIPSPAGLSYWVLQAIQQGVHRVHLLDGSMPGCLSLELFSNEGVGVMIYGDSYQEIRPLSEEDISELLAIIGRSIRAQHLVPRSYEELEANLQDYFVMTIDGNVVGSVALYPYEDGLCELACLFVKESHKGLGYGHALVKFAETEATNRGFRQIFALSTAAGGFFERQLGYTPMSPDAVPASRRAKLQASGRNSIVITKTL